MALMAAISNSAFAQSGTNSPYSQFGLGMLTEQGAGFSRGMNGLGLGFREHNQVNYLNPASLSAIDSLSFIFDAGFSGQITNFSENGVRKNANNATFDYVVAGFRAAKHFGVSFGLIPFTNIGYNYATTETLNPNSSNTSKAYSNTYNGEGGLHDVYLGFGWEPFKGFSFGATVGFLWGNYTRSVINSYSDAYVNTLAKYYTASVSNYKLDFGVQYTAKLKEKDQLTIGLTYGLGHKLNADASCKVVSTNSQTVTADTTSYIAAKALEMPTSIGAGFMWNHHDMLKFGVDYSLQKWGTTEFPQYNESNGNVSYMKTSGLFKDRHKITAGFDFTPMSKRSRSLFNRIHYRAGVSYATPYLVINGQDGPKEISATVGFGIPIMNAYNNRSMLNISAQWVNQSAKGFIKENTFRINIGLTFNERWFAKWKVE